MCVAAVFASTDVAIEAAAAAADGAAAAAASAWMNRASSFVVHARVHAAHRVVAMLTLSVLRWAPLSMLSLSLWSAMVQLLLLLLVQQHQSALLIEQVMLV